MFIIGGQAYSSIITQESSIGRKSVHSEIASGEVNGIFSADRGYLQKIVNAVNEAIVKRG